MEAKLLENKIIISFADFIKRIDTKRRINIKRLVIALPS